MDVYVIRLLPGDNLQEKLVEFVKEKRLQNAFIVTCVGSLTSAKIRLANADLTRFIFTQFFNLFLNVV